MKFFNHHLLYNNMIVLILFLLIDISYGINKFSYVGMWKLRYTNDKLFNNDYTYLKLDIDNSFNLKTIRSNGFLAVKTSKSGKINYNKFYNLFYFFNKIKNKIHLKVNLNFINVNKYYYSICGIEIPEYKFTSIDSYNLKKTLEINIIDNKLIIDIDKYKFYIFDQCDQYEKKPFIDMSFNTFIFSTILGIFLNIILMKLSY